MGKRNFFKIVFMALAVAVLGGCLTAGTNKAAGPAGIYKSVDRGVNWVPKNLFLHSGGTGSITGINLISLYFDPSDNRAIYASTESNGLFYSYDGAESWMKANPVGNGRIESVAIDPRDKCTIYATFANTVLKSIDCSRSWKEVYIDARSDKLLTALAIDPYNNSIIFAGNLAGDIFRSSDGGANWQVNYRAGDRIAKILIAPNDNRLMYVATKSKGLLKSIDAGENWTDLNAGLKEFSGALDYRNLLLDLSQADSLLLSSKYGLIKSLDGGASWTAIKLITPPSSVDIYSVAINPKNNQEIYYATATTFYKTLDGGNNWITTRLPSAAAAVSLLIDPVNPSLIYMGLANLSKN